MPRKRTTTVEEEVEREELEAAPEDASDALDQIAADASRVYLEKWTREFNAWGKCTDYAASDFTIDGVRHEWGPGKYRVRIKLENGQFHGKREFTIIGPTPGSAPAAAAAPNPLQELAEEMMRAQLARLAQPKPEPDIAKWAAIATSFLAALTPLLTAAWGGRKDPIETATKIAELVNANKTPARDPIATDAVLKILERGMELGAGGDGRGKGFGVTLLEVVPQLLELVREGNKQPPAGEPAPAAASPADRPPPLALVKPGEMGAMDVQGIIREMAPTLLQWYALGKDPAAAAGVALFHMHDAVVDELAEWTDRPEFLTAPFILAPELEPARPWVTKFLEAVREELKPDDGLPAGVAP